MVWLIAVCVVVLVLVVLHKAPVHLIRTINKEGVSIFMVEQNASLALEIAHEAYVLQTGRIVLSGSARALKDDPRVRDAYLGGAEVA